MFNNLPEAAVSGLPPARTDEPMFGPCVTEAETPTAPTYPLVYAVLRSLVYASGDGGGTKIGFLTCGNGNELAPFVADAITGMIRERDDFPTPTVPAPLHADFVLGLEIPAVNTRTAEEWDEDAVILLGFAKHAADRGDKDRMRMYTERVRQCWANADELREQGDTANA